MKDLSLMRDLLAARKAEFNRRVGEATAVRNELRGVQARRDQLAVEVDEIQAAIILLHSVADRVRERYLDEFEAIVSDGIRAVFNEPIKFKIVTDVKANRPTVDFQLEHESGLVTGLQSARGGGLLAVVGVLLRMLVVSLAPVERVLVLDEPFAHLSAEYVEPASEMVATLSRELGIQTIMVTHQPETVAYADKAYRIGRAAPGRPPTFKEVPVEVHM